MKRHLSIWFFGFFTACTSSSSNKETTTDTTQDTAVLDTADTSDTDPTAEIVAATIDGSLLLPTNYGGQLHILMNAELSAGSAMGRLRLMARFCADAECTQPLHLTKAVVDGEDSDGYYVYSTASNSGTGFDKAFTLTEAPLGASYLQLIGDTQASHNTNQGWCESLDSCPADLDILSMEGTSVTNNNDGIGEYNPPAATIPINVDAEGAEIALDGPQFIGHIVFDQSRINHSEPSDPGTLLAAMSNNANTYRNFVALIDLENPLAADGQTTSDSYNLQKNGADIGGDICGMVRTPEKLYAIAVDNDGANIFPLDATTGTQLNDSPIVTIPPTDPNNSETWPWPCRGVWAEKGGAEHLYLVDHKGAGSLDSSLPATLYYINLADGSYSMPFENDLGSHALRAITINSDATHIYALDQSWSKYSTNYGIDKHRIFHFDISNDGSPDETAGIMSETTDLVGNDTCGSQLNWKSGMAMLTMNGSDKLLVGHDNGVAVYDADSLLKEDDIDLSSFGRLFSQIVVSPDKTKAYALPQCKTWTENSDFELPAGAGTEASDKNLVAVLDLTGSSIQVASTNIDINDDGTMDNGIDMDFWHIKNYIRSFSSTLPIPPVVFTAPQIAVGESMLFARGSGIQGNGSSSISSSGMGQAQDVSFFDLNTGHGLVFNGYLPWWQGLSSDVGRAAVWGYDVYPGSEASVGWVEYLPAN